MDGSFDDPKKQYAAEMHAYVKALLDAVLRDIQEAGGDISFDWKAIIKASSGTKCSFELSSNEHSNIGEQGVE